MTRAQRLKATAEAREAYRAEHPKAAPAGSFKARGKAQAEVRAARREAKAAMRWGSKLRSVAQGNWERLGKLFRKAGAHGANTKERLLDFIGARFGHDAERAELVTFGVAGWALRQADPLAAINQQLNAAEEAADKAPKLDPSLFAEPFEGLGSPAPEAPAAPAETAADRKKARDRAYQARRRAEQKAKAARKGKPC